MRELKKILFTTLIGFLLFYYPLDVKGKSEFVQAYDKLIYNADRQNWSVSSSENGMLYFANTQGLLEFDGITWHLNYLPNEMSLRAVKVHNDSVIYSSGYRELGFWKPDKYGKLRYTSLNSLAEEYFTNNIEFWNIAVTDSFVYFHSFSNQILVYHSDTITSVELPSFTSVMNQVNGKVLIAVRNEGIFEIKGNKSIPFIKDDLFLDKLVQFIIPYKKNQILIGTASHGIFIWDGNKIDQWNNEWTEYFVKNELNRGYRSEDGRIVIGTIIDGVIVFDENGELLMKINTGNGLPNNTVLGIATDEWQNIWLALDDGIGFIPHVQSKGFIVEKIPGIGAIYSMAIHNNNQYLGTNRGLFVKELESENASFTLVPETQGQTWECKIIDNKLWIGHNQGTWLADNNAISQVSTVSGGFSIKQDPLIPGLLIQCTYNDLVTYKKIGETYVFNQAIKGFFDLIRYIEIDYLGNIWASHMYRGVYKIITDDKRENVIESRYFGHDIFGKDNSIHVFKVENRIVFTTNEKLYTYDDLNDTIIPYVELNDQLGMFASAHRIVEAPNHHYWFITKAGFGLFSIFQDEVKLIREYPVSLFKNPSIVDRFENIIPITDTTAFLCLQNGYAKLDASAKDTAFYLNNFKPVLRQIELYSNRQKINSLPLNNSHIKIKHNFNNIYFRFSFPQITGLPISYQYFMNGLQQDWSEPSTNPELRFERLPHGEYSLFVKAVDLWRNESSVFEFHFEVLPPWYTSTIALIIYIILLILILLGFRTWGIRQTRKKEMLEREKRERELIQLRNSKLRNEIEHKSKELASSTMSIIRKNEFLMDLKNIIDNQKSELGARYPDKYYNYLIKKIENNISNQDDWQIFENNFEQAHEQFFAKIKESFSDLTSSDLRLCAYLRMNLSSKEIAPLLGISVRGVENHRYRLRKKMNLEHDESLVDTITSM